MISLFFYVFSSISQKIRKQELQKEVEGSEVLITQKAETTPQKPQDVAASFVNLPKLPAQETADYTITLGTTQTPKGINAIIDAFSQAIPPSEVPDEEV